MLAFGFGRGRQGQQLLLRDMGLKGHNIADLQTAIGQCAGLIEGNSIHPAHLFQCFAGLDDHAVLGGLTDGRHNGRGRSQDQRTGAKHHQHRNRTDNISGYKACNDRDQQRNRNKPTGGLVCNACHGRLLVLRFLHHTDQLLQRAVLSDLGCLNVDGAEAVDSTAEHFFSHGLIHRQGFAGHNRLIHGCLAANNDPVHRDGLTGQNTQNISPTDLFGRNHFFFPVKEQSAPGRRQGYQLFQSLFRPFGGLILQNTSDGHDPGHLTCGKQVTDGNGRNHGDGDQQRRGYFADTGVVDHTPYPAIEYRNTADHNGHPHRVEGQKAQIYRRAAKFFYQMGDQIQQQE